MFGLIPTFQGKAFGAIIGPFPDEASAKAKQSHPLNLSKHRPDLDLVVARYKSKQGED